VRGEKRKEGRPSSKEEEEGRKEGREGGEKGRRREGGKERMKRGREERRVEGGKGGKGGRRTHLRDLQAVKLEGMGSIDVVRIDEAPILGPDKSQIQKPIENYVTNGAQQSLGIHLRKFFLQRTVDYGTNITDSVRKLIDGAHDHVVEGLEPLAEPLGVLVEEVLLDEGLDRFLEDGFNKSPAFLSFVVVDDEMDRRGVVHEFFEGACRGEDEKGGRKILDKLRNFCSRRRMTRK
jgi:hypothetical protein